MSGLRDFFHSQTITYAAGSPKRTFALVWQERRGGTTLPGLERLHRYEVWAMSRPKDEWLVDKRFFLWRVPSQDAALKPLRVVVVPALGGHAVAQTPELKLDLELRRRGDPSRRTSRRPGQRGGERRCHSDRRRRTRNRNATIVDVHRSRSSARTARLG